MSRKFHICLEGRSRGKKARKIYGHASGDGRPVEQSVNETRRMMRGNVEDIVTIGVFLVVGGIVTMFCWFVLSQFLAAPQIAGMPGAAEVVNQGLISEEILGNSLLFITIMFGIASVASAYFTRTHPVFFVFSIIVFSMCMMVVHLLSGVFLELVGTSSLLPVASHFYMLIQLMENFPLIAACLGALIIIALYAKRDDITNNGGGIQ